MSTAAKTKSFHKSQKESKSSMEEIICSYLYKISLKHQILDIKRKTKCIQDISQGFGISSFDKSVPF